MSQAFALPPDAQARMDMLFDRQSESLRHGKNGAKRELAPTGGNGREIGEDRGPGRGGDLPAAAALVEAEMVMADLRQAKGS